MSKIYLAILGISMLLVTGCEEHQGKDKDQESGNNTELFSSVMEVHDIAMARMGELHTVKKELQTEMASIDSTSRLYDSLTTLVSDLEMADEGMFDWMGEFKDPRESLQPKDAKAYLEDQMTKVNKVSEDIDSSIAAGINILTQIRKDHE